MRRITSLFILCIISLHYLLAQLSSHVEFRKQAEKDVETIQIGWAISDQQTWNNINEGRLDIMGVRTQIDSDSIPRAEGNTASYQFSFTNTGEIEILLDIQELSSGEKLSLIDSETGLVIFDVPHVSHKKILTPVFDPQRTFLKWSSEGNSLSQSHFTIPFVYVHDTKPERGRAIGFGTALNCFPNAACKTDSLLKLISNSAVRIRMVMDEGIGWCTGSFVNTTRNDKLPLVLTAYHCTFEYTPQYDLWRFDLQYKSDSCVNPEAEPQFFSLTGCQLKASGQGSDFLLVLLNDAVPVNQKVTFAGWNRDENALPDTLYLIHHPNADIRKISTSTKGAVIHPNQIGWSEGYTTPPNHHFSFKFTEGGHQPGSSGGPVFNQEGLLIAQLHGGSMGCEDANHAFSGRLAKSWNYGITAQARLKDWLDPDQTGVMTWPSIENIQKNQLMDIQGVVLDPAGRPVKNVEINITGSATQTMLSDSAGHFSLPGVTREGHYTITPGKNDFQTNGLNVLDLIAIQNHLLAKDTFDFPWQYIAADATYNQNVSVGDIVLLLRLLLGKIAFLPSSQSWRFDPPSTVLDHVAQGENSQVQFLGIKIGDLNNTANPLK